MSLSWRRNGDRWTLNASTVSEFVSFVDGAPSLVPTGQRASRERGNADQRGTRSWDDAMALARTGWADGRAEIEALRGAIVARLAGEMLAEETILDVTGHTMDMGLVTEGIPECWLDARPTDDRRAGGKIVRIVASCAASWAVDVDVIRARGAAVAALCDLLESAGRRVELIVTAGNAPRPGRAAGATVTVTAKQPDEPLQIDQIAFLAMHPSTLRRLMLSAYECIPDADTLTKYSIPGCYGYPADVDIPADITIPAAGAWNRQWLTPAGASKWLRQHLLDQGIKLETA